MEFKRSISNYLRWLSLEMQYSYSLWFMTFEIGFSIVLLIGYFLIRQSTQGKDRLLQCYKVMAVSIIFIQFYSVYLGITLGEILSFYYNINFFYIGNVAIMLCDIILQYSALRKNHIQTTVS